MENYRKKNDIVLQSHPPDCLSATSFHPRMLGTVGCKLGENEALGFVTGPPGPRKHRRPSPIPSPARSQGRGGAFSPPFPAPRPNTLVSFMISQTGGSLGREKRKASPPRALILHPHTNIKAVPTQTVPTQTVQHFKNQNTGTFSTPSPHQPQHAHQDKPTTNREIEKWSSTPAGARLSLAAPSQHIRFPSPDSCTISAMATKPVRCSLQKFGLRSPLDSTSCSLVRTFHCWLLIRSKTAMLLYVSFLLSLVDGGVRCQCTDLVLVEQEPQRLC